MIINIIVTFYLIIMSFLRIYHLYLAILAIYFVNYNMLQMPFATIYTEVQIASALFVEFWFDLSPLILLTSMNCMASNCPKHLTAQMHDLILNKT